MTEPNPDPAPTHRRRPRYGGTHPRRFEEKYKERAAEKYPELAQHVRERGMTPAGTHVPILVEDVLAALAPKPGERGVDATFGFGAHAERLLERLSPGGRLLALDVDPIQLPKTEARLRRLGHDEKTLIVRRTNFAGLRAALDAAGWSGGADFVFVDLGVSSMQIDDPSRGFTYKFDGPLDMRMNPERGLSAAQWLERTTLDELATALNDNADEPHALRIAKSLIARREHARAKRTAQRSHREPNADARNESSSAHGWLQTTKELAQAVRASLQANIDESEADLCVRRTFQALRIEVNDEFGALDLFLRDLPDCLRTGGRAAFLSFHSGEDRRVKKSLQQGSRNGIYAAVADEVIRASSTEQRTNPRSSAAKLRWARKV